MPLGQGCLGSRSLKFPTGAGEGGAKEGGPSAARPHRLGASRPDLGERWLSYLERKTEVEAGATVAWAWTLAPLPLLGAHIQTAAIGSALTVFCVGFGTRPRGKQTEFLLRREAARCFQPTRIGMESLKGRTGAETGAYLNSAFGNAKLPGQPFSGRYPRVGVPLKERLQGVLLAQPQNEPPPSRSCGDGPCARRAGRAESQSTRGRTGRRSPSVLPLCLSKAGSPGTGVRLEVTWRHPDSQAERQGWWGHPPPPPPPRRHARNTSKQKGNQTRPQNKGGKKSHPPTEDHNAAAVHRPVFPPVWGGCRGDVSMGLLPDFPP